MRRLCFGFATNKAPKPLKDSKIIVDPLEFLKPSKLTQIKSYFRTYTTIGDMKRTFLDFAPQKFEVTYLEDYNSLCRMIEGNSYKDINQYMSQDLFEIVKPALKHKQYHPLLSVFSPCNKVTIRQARLFSENTLGGSAVDRWFQLICEFSASHGSLFHVVQRHMKADKFKLVKVDLQS